MDHKILFHLFIFIIPTVLYGQNDSYLSTGEASFYHPKFHGRKTSNGEVYNQNDFTAAHKTLPFNTLVYVTNKQNNKSAVVRINDRGPFKKSRIIDLTRAAAEKLDMIPFGVVPVRIQPLTYLDRIEYMDSLFNENDIWDCFSKKVKITDSVIFVWQTASVKHAFYMASDLLLSYHLPDVFVKAVGSGKARKYKIIIPLPQVEGDADKLVMTLKTDGFPFAKFTN